MVRMVYRAQPWLLWGFVFGLGLWIILATFLRRDRFNVSLPIIMIGPLFRLGLAMRQPLYVLTDDELILIKGQGTADHMPLSGAHLERRRTGWVLSWPHSKTAEAQRLRVSDTLGLALQAAVAAKAAAPGRSAAVPVAVAGPPTWYWWTAAAAIVGLGGAIWLRQPLGLIPAYALLSLLMFQDRHYILTNSHVLVVTRGTATAAIPLTEITLRGSATLTTSHASHRTLRLEFASPDRERFVEQLKRLKSMQATTNQ